MNQTKFKKGAASLYVVMFTMMLVSIIMLGFMRLMLYETSRTTISNMSENAYDSAAAGIEDAKILLIKYFSCKNNASIRNTSECTHIISIVEANNFDCDKVNAGLYWRTGEVNIGASANSDTTKSYDQAYTCVNISLSGDYESQLTENNPSDIVPIEIDGDVSNITFMKIEWFSKTNLESLLNSGASLETRPLADNYARINGLSDLYSSLSSANHKNLQRDDLVNDKLSDLGNLFGKAMVPPIIGVEFVQSGRTFTRDQFYSSVSYSLDGNGIGTNRSNVTLVPTSLKANKMDSDYVKSINGGQYTLITEKSMVTSAAKGRNYPLSVSCDLGAANAGGYACVAYLAIPKAIDSNGNVTSEKNKSTMLARINMPLAVLNTDYRIKLFSGTADALSEVQFFGVQPIIDSTGRANNLFRRVEARVKRSASGTIVPAAELATFGSDPEDAIDKSMSVTINCYRTPLTNGTGQSGVCPDGEK